MKLIIVRGLPSSGKTTLASQLSNKKTVICCTDDYEGLYSFDSNGVQFHGMDKDEHGIPMIAKAHTWNQSKCSLAMARKTQTIIVPNTCVERWEMEAYFQMAEKHGYSVTVVSLFDGGLTDEQLVARNKHGVNIQVIQSMRSRFEHDWKNGDPRPPWQR